MAEADDGDAEAEATVASPSKRPRGRAPKGKRWDASRGAWVAVDDSDGNDEQPDAAEAVRQAEAEGLTMVRSENTAGSFATAEEAALVVARTPQAMSEEPADVVVTLEGQFVAASGAKRKIEERFEDLLRCKRFMTDEEYAAKRAELLNEI